MTDGQREKARRLSLCTMLPGGWDKRFVRDLGSRPDGYALSERQAAALEKLWHRYRRQLGAVTPCPSKEAK